MRRSSFTILVLILGLVSGCTRAPATSPAPSPEPTRAATSIPATPTQAWMVAGTDLKLQKIDDGLLLVGTFENSTGSSIVKVELSAQLIDEQGEIAAQSTLHPVPSALAAGESAGFSAVFPDPGRPVTPSVRVLTYEHGPVNEARVSVKIAGVHPGSDGRTYLLGEIFNQSANYVRLNDLLFLTANAGEEPGAGRLIPSNKGLAPRSSTYFLAGVAGKVPKTGWKTFVDASISGTPDSPRLVLIEPIVLRVTEQGRPFYILQVQNQGILPRWLGGQLAIFDDEKLVSLTDIAPTVPLQPQEIRVLSIKKFPGLPADPASNPGSAETWRAEFELDSLRSRPALESILEIRVEITQFETIGGLIYIRGSLANDHSIDVLNPTVQIVPRDQAGRALDSAWVTPADGLAAGDTVSFELTLSLPAGASAEMSEYDVQGWGIAGVDE